MVVDDRNSDGWELGRLYRSAVDLQLPPFRNVSFAKILRLSARG